MPNISIIMPVYNKAQHLDTSLQSFFCQSIQDSCELICVDDGSTDDSLQILEQWQAKHPENIRIIKQQNQGSGIARNNAIDVAQGDYIGFLDADDLYPSKTVLEQLSDAAQSSEAAIVGGSMQAFLNDIEFTDYSTMPGFEGQTFNTEGLVRYQDYQFDYGYQRFIYSRQLLNSNSIRFPDYLRYQDPPFFVKVMIAAQYFYAITEHTYRYRESEQNFNWSDRQALDMIKGITDVGVLAAKHDYEQLFKLNLERLDSLWYPTIHRLVIESGRMSVLEGLYNAKCIMANTTTNLDTSTLLAQTPFVQKDIPIIYRRLKELELEAEDLLKGNTELRLEADKLIKERDELRVQADDYRIKYQEVLQSTTWKVGSAVTWLPRKIKDHGNSDSC